MTLDKNDPRLTAYALGELDESERADVETGLADLPDARDEIESIRQIAGELTKAYAVEPAPGLDQQRKQAIETREARHGAEQVRRKKRYWPMALAASLLLIAAVAVLMPSFNKARQRSSVWYNPSPVMMQAESVAQVKARRLSATESNQLIALGYSRQQSGNQVAMVSKTSLNYAADDPNERARVMGAGGGFGGMGGGGLGAGPLLDMYQPLGEQKSVLGDFAYGYQTATANTERYQPIFENSFRSVTQYPLSTFSIDVDTASYSNLRRFINGGSLPPPDAVRIEEMINYFNYDYPPPADGRPFSVTIDVVDCPWNTTNLLARIGLKGVEVAAEDRPPSNLVFLIDVSGSMQPANKLPLVKQALRLLVEQLDELDRVAIVVYAGASGMALDSTTGDQQRLILDSIDELQSGGSTNGGAGIELAYDLATRNFIDGGTNRVILCTDGDFNVGVTDRGSLTRLIKDKAKSGVFLSALGFGMGNLNDATLESLADNGNGNYAYIDTWTEARKVLVEQLTGTLVTIAKDVKIQIEFNPAQAAAYRLIGYENRLLAAEDFNDDTKDAGEIGAGHTVTALYEITPAGAASESPAVDPLKYQSEKSMTAQASSDELMTVKLRYKLPDGDTSRLIERAVKDEGLTIDDASDDMRFCAGVASFGMLLRHSDYAGDATFESVLGLAENGLGEDAGGYRSEFIQLARTAANLTQ